MKHSHHVRLDAQGSRISTPKSILQNPNHRPIPLSRPVIVGIILGMVPPGILDVDVLRDIAHLSPELPRILSRMRLRPRAVRIEDRIGGIKNPLQTRHRFQQPQRMPPTHPAIIHAILVQRLDTGLQKTLSHLTHPTKTFLLHQVGTLPNLVAHHADVSRTQSLHAGNRTLHLRQSDIERILHVLGPVPNGRSKAVHRNPRRLQGLLDLIKGRVRQVVEIGLREARQRDIAGLDVLPAQLAGRGQLGLQEVSGFVADAAVQGRKAHAARA